MVGRSAGHHCLKRERWWADAVEAATVALVVVVEEEANR